LSTLACDPAIEFNCPVRQAVNGQLLPVALRAKLLPNEMIAAVSPKKTTSAAAQCQAAALPKNLLFNL